MVRALYHGANIYLLDDVLSAVDAHVARAILQNVILGPFMNQRTCILCSHNIQVGYFFCSIASQPTHASSGAEC